MKFAIMRHKDPIMITLQEVKMMTRCGIDRVEEFSHILLNKRLGLVTGSSGIGCDYRSSIEILHEKYNLTTLFAPEHGVRGELQGGVKVHNHIDWHSGLPVYSLFSDDRSIIDDRLLHNSILLPSQEALDRVDAIVFDIQDVGSRYYTYASTLFFVMKACAKAGKECIVLDRPNPIGGMIEGNSHRPENFSFIGLTKVPIRHGMTLGELALFYNGEYQLDCQLHVIPVDGWNRSMYFEDTGLPFVCPSPNLPNQDAIILYNGICMLAGTNVSDARGTTRPFEQFGAPYINPFELKESLDALHLPALRFSVTYFIPTFFKYQGEVCAGVQIHVLDRRMVKPVELGVKIIRTLQKLYPDNFQFKQPENGRYHIDVETGTDEVRLNEKSADDILSGWQQEAEQFALVRTRYSLYE